MLQIYNSLTRKKEVFVPLVPKKIGIYVCGITVYDYCHLGHARSLVSFDVIVRYLRARDYKVNYVRNITDIDDKIINRANELNEPWQAVTERFIKAMKEDEQALNIVSPDEEPKATDHVTDIIALIERLIERGYAYVATSGDVYYDVSRFENYGHLSGKDLEGQTMGARVEIVPIKHNPFDFVLWKQAKPGEPSWQSPWGTGRPGWHIECSAMSMNCLGETFDIHGGGFDLQFPHHENEIAQSEGATGKPFAKLWMHVGFLNINEEKMSKSLGNFFTIREILQKYHPETLRYFLLMSHYRSQLNYSLENLDNAKEGLHRFYQTLRGIKPAEGALDNIYEQRFYSAMDDDFNTPEALAVLFDIAREINRVRYSDDERAAILAKTLLTLAKILGLLEHSVEDFLQLGVVDDELSIKIEALIQARQEARAEKNWAESDRIRDEIKALGIELEDTPQGPIWQKII